MDWNIEINGVTYGYAYNLRVAFEMQGQFNHKPYTTIFNEVSEMPVEDQLKLLYTAFKVKNPEPAKNIAFKDFMNYYLDNYTLEKLLADIKGLSAHMMGKENIEELTEEKSGDGQDKSETGNGNN